MSRDDGTIMGGARALGALLDRDEIPELTPIDPTVWRMRRQDIWPPEVWEEMQKIYRAGRQADVDDLYMQAQWEKASG